MASTTTATHDSQNNNNNSNIVIRGDYDDDNDNNNKHKIPYRFVRFNPRFDMNETLQKLKEEVNEEPYPIQVPWLNGYNNYYALPSTFVLQKSSKLFHTGHIYGQDVSSGAAIAALMTNKYDDDDDDIINTDQQHDEDFNNNNNIRTVLDLCCCPGQKLCAIADHILLQQQQHNVNDNNAFIVGVDISEQRMAVCKRIVHKYQIASCNNNSQKDDNKSNNIRIRLYCNDATTFTMQKNNHNNLVFDSLVAQEEECNRLQSSSSKKRKRMNKSAKAREQKQLQAIQDHDDVYMKSCFSNKNNDGNNEQLLLFDRVLVDAECSTDGSIIHVQKRLEKDATRKKKQLGQKLHDDNNNSDNIRISDESDNLATTTTTTVSKDLMNNSNQNYESLSTIELIQLQQKLILSGFHSLKIGGVMVYSTCSLQREQNENIVQYLINMYPTTARIIPVKFVNGTNNDLVKEGTIKGTVQFLPNIQQQKNDNNTFHDEQPKLYGGGFFLAKIQKIK